MKIEKYPKRKRITSILNLVFLCFLVIVAVRAKGQRKCCGGTDAKDMCIIYKVINDRYYSPLEFDTLKTRFCYRLVKEQANSFDYVKIYFFGVSHGNWPYRAFGSDETLKINKANYSYDEKWDSLFFTGFANPDSYEIYVIIEGWLNGRQSGPAVLAQKSGDTLTHVSGPGGRQLVLFMGNRRICNCGNTLKDPYAYPLMVQVTDSAGNGINGDTVWFKADYGIFEGGINDFPTITDTFHYIANEELLSGISRQPYYIFPNEARNIVVTVQAFKSGQMWAEKFINLRCFNDPETSGLNPPKCHETTDTLNKNVEIPGDGYNDGTGKKTIRVEIDYASDILNIEHIQNGLFYMKQILATARLDTMDANFIVDEGFDCLDPIPTWMIRTYLAGSRDYRDCIHIVIGSKREDTNDFGETVSYNLSDWGGLTHTQCGHLASTDSAITQKYLDSTGIFIYVQQIIDSWWAANWDTLLKYGWNSWYKPFGVTLAHEIGHALGILTHDEKGVMQEKIIWRNYADTYMYFVDSLLNKNPPEDAMNTRDVLGIHTIDTGW